MFLLSKPSEIEIRKLIKSYAITDLSYEEVGATALETGLSGYVIDYNRIKIGNGSNDLEKAKASVREWKMFDIPWIRLCWPETPIETGQVVAVLIDHLGFYSLNPARIVYVIDEPTRFGFAYGTLAEHAECGEERFMVQFEAESKDVFYDIFAFSKPNHFLAKIGYPVARLFQKRFAQHSMAAMKRAMN